MVYNSGWKIEGYLLGNRKIQKQRMKKQLMKEFQEEELEKWENEWIWEKKIAKRQQQMKGIVEAALWIKKTDFSTKA